MYCKRFDRPLVDIMRNRMVERYNVKQRDGTGRQKLSNYNFASGAASVTLEAAERS